MPSRNRRSACFAEVILGSIVKPLTLPSCVLSGFPAKSEVSDLRPSEKELRDTRGEDICSEKELRAMPVMPEKDRRDDILVYNHQMRGSLSSCLLLPAAHSTCTCPTCNRP